MRARRVVVVGGGISGLTAAYRLLGAGHDAGGAPLSVTVLEERPRLGGNIQTERRNGFVIDGGPDSFVVSRPQALALCKELGLADRLIGTTERNRKVYVRHDGALELMPEGLALAIPTQVMSMARSHLFSWPGKARMALEVALPRRRPIGDESLGHFLRRRLGVELVERLAGPLLGGIYAGNIDTLSLRSTFPQLLDLEQKHRSLILGALAQRAAARGDAAGKPASMFQSLLGGMGELIDALAAKVGDRGGIIRVGARVQAIEAARAGTEGSPRLLVRVADAAGAIETIQADDVLLTTPAHAAAAALDGLDRELAARLRRIPYVSTATVVLGYARADVPHALDALGLIIPKREGRRALAATFISSKWAGRAPDDSALLRVFLGGYRDGAALEGNDDELVTLARAELDGLVGVRARPTLSRVFRFDRGNPQPVVGHATRVQKIRALAAQHPGLHFAGAAFDGVGIPDCVRQAGEASERIAAQR